jgi:peptidoglycan/LPS O-acetylase OafA/YrhL
MESIFRSPSASDLAAGQLGDFPLSSHQINVLKGMLIALVVLFHVPSKHAGFLDIRAAVYNFHALAFLVLPFAYPLPDRPIRQMLRSRFIRYYVPTLWFTSLAAALTLVVTDTQPGLFNLAQLGKALLIGTAPAMDKATGFQLYWFLPALFGLFLYRLVSRALPYRALQISVLYVSASMFLLMGAFGRKVLGDIPIFATISLYAVFLSICVFALLRLMLAATGRIADLAVAVVWLGLLVFLVATDRRYNIALYNVPNYSDPVGLVGYVLAVALALRVGVSLRRIPALSRVLNLIGSYSLEIYLGHILVMGGLVFMLGSWLNLQENPWHVALIGLLTLALSLTFSVILRKFGPVSRLVFPSGGTSDRTML